MFKQDDSGKQVPEAFTEEAKYFTEVRLLQRDVQIILEGVSNQNLLGTVIHPVSSHTHTCTQSLVGTGIHPVHTRQTYTLGIIMLIHFDTFSMHLVFICTVKNF
jgi:hypothetical protein